MFWSTLTSQQRTQHQSRHSSKSLNPSSPSLSAYKPFRLKDLQGDWHEFESKALRKENERKNQEARRAARNESHEKEKAKRRASASGTDRDTKKVRLSATEPVEPE